MKILLGSFCLEPKLRNALSHGAILAFGNEENLLLGHVFFEGIRILASAATHKMIANDAYFRSQRRIYLNEQGDSLSDWLAAEGFIRDLLNEAMTRRYPPQLRQSLRV